jgi:hypothetical protein
MLHIAYGEVFLFVLNVLNIAFKKYIYLKHQESSFPVLVLQNLIWLVLKHMTRKEW